MKNLKLRIDAKLANKYAEDAFPQAFIRRKKKITPSPLTKCTGRGACGSTNCMLRAHHLGPCVWHGGYLPTYMKSYLVKEDALAEGMQACEL